jgi:hypothetical protein
MIQAGFVVVAGECEVHGYSSLTTPETLRSTRASRGAVHSQQPRCCSTILRGDLPLPIHLVASFFSKACAVKIH